MIVSGYQEEAVFSLSKLDFSHIALRWLLDIILCKTMQDLHECDIYADLRILAEAYERLKSPPPHPFFVCREKQVC